MTRKLTFSLDLGWRALLTDFGMKPEHVLSKAGLPQDQFSRPDQGLDTDAYFRFWRVLEQEAGDPLFPLHLVGKVSAEVFNAPLFAALCSANMMQAVQRLAKYKQLVAPMALDVTVGGAGELTVAPRWLSAPAELPCSLQAAEVAFLLRLARLGTREPVRARRVVLPWLPPANCARRFENFFGVAVERGDVLAISFAAADTLRPFLTVNERMWRVFEPDLRRRLGELDATATTGERVRAVLLELVPASVATLEKAAERLGMSKRTLQRRLEDEGENFRSLVGATRESLARHYLGSTTMSSAEIAFLLGFEDPSSFYRAFLAWTGQSPEAVRGALRPR